ncbi:hypothetical protein Mgra_00008907 [Meloidogyne graminicola]|uniref:Uncharacterized protein n=1 Tax=Meloidogyne graminicola TaxID=189291 RepID=A0A8S9ZED1_9BILA|nr:hypothetical protein Mgra_00008907 [Meloidogyne graminicola]
MLKLHKTKIDDDIIKTQIRRIFRSFTFRKVAVLSCLENIASLSFVRFAKKKNSPIDHYIEKPPQARDMV